MLFVLTTVNSERELLCALFSYPPFVRLGTSIRLWKLEACILGATAHDYYSSNPTEYSNQYCNYRFKFKGLAAEWVISMQYGLSPRNASRASSNRRVLVLLQSLYIWLYRGLANGISPSQISTIEGLGEPGRNNVQAFIVVVAIRMHFLLLFVMVVVTTTITITVTINIFAAWRALDVDLSCPEPPVRAGAQSNKVFCTKNVV